MIINVHGSSEWYQMLTTKISISRALLRPADLLPVSLILFFSKLFCCSGILACLDGYMNIAMEQTEEYVNGQLKNKYGDAFIRGNNGTSWISKFISLLCLLPWVSFHRPPPILQSAYAYVSWHLLPECSFIHQHIKADSHWWRIDPSGALPFLSCNSKAINLVALWLDPTFQSLYLLSEVWEREDVSDAILDVTGILLPRISF